MNDQNQTKLSEADLDRLQVRWVLGKNRGVEIPLVKEELGPLLDSDRMTWSSLKDKEKRMFLDDKQYTHRIDEWKLKEQKKTTTPEKKPSDDRVNNVIMLVKGMKVFLEAELIKKTGKEEWEELLNPHKERFLEEYFKYIYGVTSPTMVRVLLGGIHG